MICFHTVFLEERAGKEMGTKAGWEGIWDKKREGKLCEVTETARSQVNIFLSDSRGHATLRCQGNSPATLGTSWASPGAPWTAETHMCCSTFLCQSPPLIFLLHPYT